MYWKCFKTHWILNFWSFKAYLKSVRSIKFIHIALGKTAPADGEPFVQDCGTCPKVIKRIRKYILDDQSAVCILFINNKSANFQLILFVLIWIGESHRSISWYVYRLRDRQILLDR